MSEHDTLLTMVRDQLVAVCRSSYGKESVLETRDGIAVSFAGYVVLVRVDLARIKAVR